MGLHLDFEPVIASLPFLAQGVVMTLAVTIVAMIGALVWGLVIALLRSATFLPIRLLATAYIDFFRGVPLLVFLLWIYFGVSVAFGLNLSPLEAALAALIIQTAAGLAEVYRSGLEAIPKEQVEAAQSLGLTPVQSFKDIVFPQALRIILPVIGNDFIGMLKGSALVSILGVVELMRASQMRANFYLRPFEFLSAAAIIYIVLALVWGHLFATLEGRFKW